MHVESLELMEQMLHHLPYRVNATVLDVGSLDINGSYRELVNKLGYLYYGLDVRPGKNVDIVADYPYQWSLNSNTFDAVICGNSLHNIPNPYLVIKEMTRVLKVDGLLAIVTVWSLGLNEYPKDYWRFMPDGLIYFMQMTTQLQRIQAQIANNQDVIAWGFKQ